MQSVLFVPGIKETSLSLETKNLGSSRLQTLLIPHCLLLIAQTTISCQLFAYLLFPSIKSTKHCFGSFFDSSFSCVGFHVYVQIQQNLFAFHLFSLSYISLNFRPN